MPHAEFYNRYTVFAANRPLHDLLTDAEEAKYKKATTTTATGSVKPKDETEIRREVIY